MCDTIAERQHEEGRSSVREIGDGSRAVEDRGMGTAEVSSDDRVLGSLRHGQRNLARRHDHADLTTIFAANKTDTAFIATSRPINYSQTTSYRGRFAT